MIIISVLVFLFLIILGHYFAWHLCLAVFPAWQAKKFRLLFIFITITFIFLTDFIWLHQSNSIFFQYLYILSAILFGFLSQLMLFGFFFYFFKMLIKYWVWLRLHLIIKFNLLAKLFFGGAILFFILGTYNAFFPRVKTITLSNFSDQLRGNNFIQLSDLHLGVIYRPLWLKMIIKQVNFLKPDFVIISGDLFDGSDKYLSEFIPVLKTFASPVIFVPGNHDYYIPREELEKIITASNFILLSDEALKIDDIEIIGFNYVGRENSNLNREIKNLSNDQSFRIVVNHVPVDQKEAQDLKANLMLSGHTHRGQIFPFSAFLNLLYGRFAYGLEKYQNMITYTSAGVGTWGPPLRTLFPGEIIHFFIK